MSRLLQFYTKSRNQLVLPYEFNEPLEIGDIFKSIKVLDFRNTCFNQPIKKGVISFGITAVYFSEEYNCHLEEGVFPESVNEIIFMNRIDISRKNTFPKSLKYLEFQTSTISKYLRKQSLVRKRGEEYTSEEFEFSSDIFPENLKTLIIKCYGNLTIDLNIIPTNLDIFRVTISDGKLKCINKFPENFLMDVLLKLFDNLIYIIKKLII